MQLPPPVHGVTVVNENIVRSEWLASRFHLDVLPLQFSRTVGDINRVSARKLVRALATGARLARRLFVRRPDAVYFTLAPTGGAFYRDCLYIGIIKVFRVPRILHLHGKGVADQTAVRWKFRLYAWAFRDAQVIHLSPLLVPDLAGVVPEDRVLCVPNGVVDRAASSAISRRGRPRVLYLSNMIETKGPLVLLEALGLLAAQGIDFEATFAGAEFNDGCLDSFHVGVRRMGLKDRCRYVGPAYGEDKDALFRDHDVFAFPTFNDAFPLVILEAMQHGLPVVSTFEGSIPEMVEHGETGYLVPKHDERSLSERLSSLLVDPALRIRMGERGRARFVERYTMRHFETNLATALLRMLDQVPPPR